jgi:WD40 repeat-containing protein SMU1
MAECQVGSGDVIRVILQYLAEHDLPQTLQVLQEETKVALNAVESPQALLSDITAGRWDSVLRQFAMLELPIDILQDTYEHVVLEMVEGGDRDIAKTLLESMPLQVLQNDHPIRFHRIENFVKRGGEGNALFEMPKEKMRHKIADQVKPHLVQAKPGRLRKLINQALSWQKHMGLAKDGDVFRSFDDTKVEEAAPQTLARQIKFGNSSHPESCAFSPDGKFFISGSVDGFIEIWDVDEGVLRKDLPYQEDETFMMHDASVAALHVNRESTYLAAGDSSGVVKVWELATGQCMRRIQAHKAGITSVMIHKDNHQVLTTSFDGEARLFAMKSGQKIKEYTGHESYVNLGRFSPDHSSVVTVSSDGKVRVFDAQTTETLHEWIPPTPAHLNSALQLAVLSFCWASVADSNGNPTLYVLTKSNSIFHLTLNGKLLKTYTNGKSNKHGGDFSAFALSSDGKWLIGGAEDRMVYIFSAVDGKLQDPLDANLPAETEMVYMACHPSRSLCSVCSNDGSLSVLEP